MSAIKRGATMKSPANCTFKELVRIHSDNHDAGDFWILTDTNEVTIAAQKPGHPATAMVSIPRRKFNQLIAWYIKPQRIKATRRGK